MAPVLGATILLQGLDADACLDAALPLREQVKGLALSSKVLALSSKVLARCCRFWDADAPICR